jgi:RNA polymerase sigma-70 factor (ECF subfamily)
MNSTKLHSDSTHTHSPSPAGRLSRRTSSAQEAAHDAVLVRRFNAGDESAFLEIMARYRERTYMIACSLIRNHADAEELTQDTFIRAHRGLARFRGDSSLSTWLHRIVSNLAKNRYWYFFRRQRHATLSLDFPLGEDSALTLEDLVASDESDPARAASAAEFSGLVEACMQRLSRRQREILTLRNTLHQSYEDIAAALGIRVGTVKSRIARARESIRRMIAEMCPELKLGDWFERTRLQGCLEQAAA